jgi:hypothetical protein
LSSNKPHHGSHCCTGRTCRSLSESESGS